MKIKFYVRKTDRDLKGKLHVMDCETLEQGAKAFRAFLVGNDLGASLCHEAIISDPEGKTIARVSYNGRLWDRNDNPINN